MGARASGEPVPWERRSVTVGDWRISALSDGWMRLDGGSMWGVVPKSMWSRWTPARDDNTILIALRPFLAERGADKVVIEVGIGERWDAKWRSLYAIERPHTLESTLRACGVAPAEVTHVVASHCHFDHIGAQVVLRDGRLVPLFPNARHFAPRVEVEVAKHADHVRRASYRAEDVLAIEAAGLLETFEGDAELLPGLRVHEAAGHSDGLSIVTLGEQTQGDTAIFWTDVVPTTHHVQPPYIMAYDLDVARSYASRSRWLERAARERWLGLFYHDSEHAFARLERDGRRYVVQPVAGEPRAPAGPG